MNDKEFLTKYKLMPFETAQKLTMMPDNYIENPKIATSILEWGNFLFDMARKIQVNGTPEQIEKFNRLQNAYVNIVDNANNVQRLEFTTGHWKNIAHHALNENDRLRKENDKLLKTLNFTNE